MKTSKFSGPLFIIGIPRSGTKLLRDLLNQNPRIGIPPAETQIIPYLVNRFGNPPNFGNNDEFDRFYEELKKSTFWGWMEQEGFALDKDIIVQRTDMKSWSSIFEVILKFYAPPGRIRDFIWGDKSPIYLCHMKLLKEIFPNAKFLHIIRDPRDCCLSAKKIWGKNLYRTAELWRQRLEIARADGIELGKDYIEVLYETLLEDPEKVMHSICDFLDCDFISEMTKLSKPSDNLGDTKGKLRIVKNNIKKYIIELSPSEIRRIEEIIYPIAKSIPYNLEYDVTFKPLGSLMLNIFMLFDGWAMVKFNIHEKGLLQGIAYSYRELMESSRAMRRVRNI